MSLTAEETRAILDNYQLAPGDTGSPEVQVAILSARVSKLTEHLKQHSHDYHSQRGLLKILSHRRKLLKYLKHVDHARYRDIIKRLKLRS